MDGREIIKKRMVKVILKDFESHEFSLNECLEITGTILFDILYQYRQSFPDDYVAFVQDFLSSMLTNIETYVKTQTDKADIDIQSQIDSIFEKGIKNK
jgi:hypothetical protein